MGAAVAAVELKPASLSRPRLEEWPGFPCPSKAFARAAPMENPKGGLPPSPQVLRFIHQVASAKAEGTPALYGLLDESALTAVGVLVEEMLEELVSPMVDGRTTGYKRATPASVARELEMLGRMENRNSMALAADLPGHRHGALDGDSGCSGFGVGAVGSLDARKHAAMRHIFGETLDDMRRQQQQKGQRRQHKQQQQQQQQREPRQQLHAEQLEQLREKENELETRRRREEQQEEQRQHEQRAGATPLKIEGKHTKEIKKRKQRKPEHLQQPPHHGDQQEHVRREQKKRKKGKKSKT
ncbi:unnamed protein product [Ectocarpus sp. 12 AP-2014]